MPLSNQRQAAFEQADCVAEIAPDDVETGEGPTPETEAVGIAERLSEPDACFAVRDPFVELSLVRARTQAR